MNLKFIHFISLSLFVLFLAIFLLVVNDFQGFFIFITFFLSFAICTAVSYRREKNEKKKQEKIKLFNSISIPNITTTKIGNSMITTLRVPSPELFEEVKKQAFD